MYFQLVAKSIFVVVAAIAGILVGILSLNIVTASESTGPAEVRSADNDAEWIEIIEEAAEAQRDGAGRWEDPRYGPNVTEVSSCGEIPEHAVQTGAGFDRSLDGREHRAIVRFSDQETGSTFALTLRSDQEPPADCPDDVVALIAEPSPHSAAVDAALCEQMTRMARGEEPTDGTLRPASAEVAEAYLEAFCSVD